MTVTLNNLSHTSPDDIDILLVGPGGQNAIIMSDVGGLTPASGVNLTLDDAAASNLPDSGPLVSGTFKPTNAGGADAFPAPAPPPSGGSALSVFNGTDPNGTWSLYIRDDAGGEAGSIAGGWCLNITTVEVTPCTLTCPSDVTQAADPGQCGAVVTYSAPTTTGDLRDGELLACIGIVLPDRDYARELFVYFAARLAASTLLSQEHVRVAAIPLL